MYVIKYCIDFAGRNVYGLDLQENKTAGSMYAIPSVDDFAEFLVAVEPDPKISDRINPTNTAFQ